VITDIEVSVTDRSGTPVTDATVTAVFSMPPMPAMNMPAMRSDAPLTHAGNGTYRGTGQLSMGGTWNVNVTVSRGTETLGTSRFSIVAK
jgi:nitrogen fixation protein FixH